MILSSPTNPFLHLLPSFPNFSVCVLPLKIGKGWQMTCLDLVSLCKNAFGTEKPNTLAITVKGECRLSKIFFHNKRYSDAEMPPHLRSVG